MEGIPQTDPNKKPDDPDKKKKGSRTGASVRFPGFAEVATDKDAERRTVVSKESTREKLLESLGVRKEEPKGQSATEESTDKPTESATVNPVESSEVSEVAEHTDDKPKKPEQEPLPSHELAPNELSGGEVIIHLTGDQALAERVIPLHEESAPAIAEASEPATSELTETEDAVPRTPVERLVEPEQSQVFEEELEPVAAAGGLPPRPPRPPAPAGVAMPQPPEQPVPRPYYEGADTLYGVPPVEAGDQVATKEDVEDALRSTGKRSQGRGVLAGLLVAGGFEHFRHKRREKKLERQLKKQSKELGADRKDRHFYFEEQQKQQVKNEQRFAGIESKVEKAGPKPPSPENPEQLQVPEGHHIETSAWHSIEVDSKTGKAVESPAFAYGQEYYRERARESAPILQRNTAAGEVALVAAAAHADQTNPGATPTAIPLANTQGSPSRRVNLSLSGGLKTTSSTQAGPLWPWLIALVVIVVCLALILH